MDRVDFLSCKKIPSCLYFWHHPLCGVGVSKICLSFRDLGLGSHHPPSACISLSLDVSILILSLSPGTSYELGFWPRVELWLTSTLPLVLCLLYWTRGGQFRALRLSLQACWECVSVSFLFLTCLSSSVYLLFLNSRVLQVSELFLFFLNHHHSYYMFSENNSLYLKYL